jgi:hypothetical protein
MSLASSAICLLAGSYFAFAQTPAGQHPMTFFLTSVGVEGGANFGGLAGADAHCQELAASVGAGNRTWHAYLSAQARPGQPAIDARDRIGAGPWYNAHGAMIARDVAELHAMKSFAADMVLTEKGVPNPGSGTPADPDDKTWAYMQTHPGSIRHEILTGSTREGRAFTDGRDHSCNNWTSEEDGNSPARARFNTGPGAEIGKSDNTGPWNSQGISGGCSHVALARSHGAGLNYCFAVD